MAAMESEREAREGSILDQRIAHFLRTWKPEGDAQDIEHFTMDLMAIVRATFIEAARPEAGIAYSSLALFFSPKEK